MGTRYLITVECPECAAIDKDIYYAPTCNFISHICSGCGAYIDLVEYTGISYEGASTVDLIGEIIATGMLEHDFVVQMPPVREYTLRVRIKSIEKATPHIVGPED